MMKWAVVAVVALSVAATGGEVSSLEGVETSQCGVNSLYLCLKYHGTKQELDELYEQVPADASGNVSLKQLADYARGKGLWVKPITKPTAADVQSNLTRDTSIILQCAMDMPDKSKFRHIVALVKPQESVLLMDYPRRAREIGPEKLVALVAKSEGMLVLSTRPLTSLADLLDFKSLRSWGFYAIFAGLAMLVVVVAGNVRRGKAVRKV
jgi:ABC-type bacteriocin/lantibiotic exporter with double-glycine peptidase domain